jgi:hypothetical protein
MDRWFEAYAKWTPATQLLFSVVMVLGGLVLLAMTAAGLCHAIRYLTVLARGWPDRPAGGKKPQAADLVEFVEVCRLLQSVGRLRLVPLQDGSVEIQKLRESPPTLPGGLDPRDFGIDRDAEMQRLADEQALRDARETLHREKHPTRVSEK